MKFAGKKQKNTSSGNADSDIITVHTGTLCHLRARATLLSKNLVLADLIPVYRNAFASICFRLEGLL